MISSTSTLDDSLIDIEPPTPEDCLIGTQPHIITTSPSNSDVCPIKCQTMHQKTGLKTACLLELILAPDLEEKLTPGALLAADNLALFQLLHLILAAVVQLGERGTKRENFVRLVKVLRARIVACRGLKLRFLLSAHNDACAAHWNVRMVHRRHCYAAARRYLHELVKDVDNLVETESSYNYLKERYSQIQIGSKAPSFGASASASASATSTSISSDSALTGGKLNPNVKLDTKSLVTFAAQSLLHPEHGIKMRTIMFRFRSIRNAFFGSELVDAIMERSNFRSRDDAKLIAQRLIDMSVLQKAASTTYRFHDDKKCVLQSNVALQRDDAGHCQVTTHDGYVLTSWDDVKKAEKKQVKQISMQIPMDMIDLQSFEFWTKSVYVKGVDKGYRYGYRAVTHPLYCRGINPFASLEFTSKHEAIDDDDDDNDDDSGDVDSTEEVNGDMTKEVLSSSSGSAMSAIEINDMDQESAVIGSVVVRKVFSSIARPMIIELRVPLENADLDDDDHHITLSPGLLVKEGDNLMQDLSVETMFQCFNHIWAYNPSLRKKYGMVPESISYEVFPTSTSQGFMEAVTGLTSLKEFNWKIWRDEYGKDEARVNEMVRTTVGSYIGAYIVGGRDRHFDNVLVKADLHLLHIDFGFIMGNNPPIDGPPIAIAPQMELVFRELNKWETFSKMFVDAFMALREQAPAIIRTSVMLFTKAGFTADQVRNFLTSKASLNVHESDQRASEFINKQLQLSSGDIKTRFKQFAHTHIDPAWYGLLEKGFPPAIAIMKVVDAKDNRIAKKLAQNRRKLSNVPEDYRIQVQEEEGYE